MKKIALLVCAFALAACVSAQNPTKEERTFMRSVSLGDEAAVELMLQRNPKLLKAKARTGVSAVTVAVYYSQPKMVKLLLRFKPTLSLQDAVAIGDPVTAKKLLAKDKSLANKMTPDGTLPLCLAVAFKHPEVAKVLLDHGAKINAHSKGFDQVAPLNSAVFGRDLRCVKLLLQRGANPNVVSSGNFQPLHEASANGDVEIVKLLISKGANVKAKTPSGDTPLSLATRGKHKAVVDLLTKHGG